MKIRYIGGKAQQEILEDYRCRNPDGSYTMKLSEIAEKHEVSLSTVNNLARAAGCQGRPHGSRARSIPDARTLKILRDSTEPGITFKEIGKRNPRVVRKDGKLLRVPLSKQRVKQIIDTWKGRGNPGVRVRGFEPGDTIEWAKQRYQVLRYDDTHKGAAKHLESGEVFDPFYWVKGGERSRRIVEVSKK